MAKPLSQCPVCQGGMTVAELQCNHCKTSVHSQFDLCRFCRLPADQYSFIELFLRCEGNLTRVGEELGISYPTVRNRLQNALNALQLNEEPSSEHSTVTFSYSVSSASAQQTAEPADHTAKRREVLDALAHGDMSAEEAAQILKDLT